MRYLKLLVILGLLSAPALAQNGYETGTLRDHTRALQTGWHDGVYCVGFEYRDCSGDWTPTYEVQRGTILVTADGIAHRLNWKTKFWGNNFSPEQLLDLTKDGIEVAYRIKGNDVFILDPAGRELRFSLKR